MIIAIEIAAILFLVGVICQLVYHVGHSNGYHAALKRLREIQDESAKLIKEMNLPPPVTKEDYKT